MTSSLIRRVVTSLLPRRPRVATPYRTIAITTTTTAAATATATATHESPSPSKGKPKQNMMSTDAIERLLRRTTNPPSTVNALAACRKWCYTTRGTANADAERVRSAVLARGSRIWNLSERARWYDDTERIGLLTVYGYTAWMDVAFRQQRFEDIPTILERMVGRGVPPTVATMNFVVGSYLNHRDLAGARWWFDRFVQSGIHPDKQTFQLIMRYCADHDLADDMQEWRACMGHASGFDGATAAHLMVQTLCEKGKVDEAIAQYQSMLSSGIKSTPRLAAAVVSVLARCGRMESAERWFYNDFKDNIRPTTAIFNSLIHGYLVLQDADGMRGSYQTMASMGLRADTHTYRLMVSLASLTHDVDTARQWHARMLAAGVPRNTEVEYEVLRRMVELNDTAAAHAWFDSMVTDGVEVNGPVVNMMVSTFCIDGDIDGAEQFITQFPASMVSNGCYEKIVRAYAAKGDIARAVSITERMMRGGRNPTALSLGALVRHYASANDLASATTWFDKYIYLGFTPDAAIYGDLLQAAGRQRDVQLVRWWWQHLTDRGVPVTGMLCARMVEAYSVAGDMDNAVKWMQRIMDTGAMHDALPVASHHMVCAWCIQGHLTAAQTHLNTLMAAPYHMRPLDDTFARFIVSFGRIDASRAWIWYERALGVYTQPTVLLVNALLSTLIHAGDMNGARRVRTEIEHAGLVVNDKTRRLLSQIIK